MLTLKEKLELITEANQSGLHPEVINLPIGICFKNAERTADDKAAVGGSWKQFWKIFAQEDFPTICPFCGRPLAEEDIDGCHIRIAWNRIGGAGFYSFKKYIIPGHHSCNMQLGDEFISKISIKAVEAIDREID